MSAQRELRAEPGTSVGPWSKLRIAAGVGLALVLLATAAGLVTWLAERRGWRARFDLTADSRNTLDPVLADLVEKLPDQATIEVLFAPMPKVIAAAGNEAQGRTRDLLRVLQNAAPHAIKVREHSPDDVSGAREALARLRVDGDEFGLVVVHRGEKKAVLRLFTDIAQLDLGNPDPNRYVPPRLVSYRGEEAIAGALKRVALEGRAKVLFTQGHGERDLYAASNAQGGESGDLGALDTALVADGFVTERYEGGGQPIPEDCAVLAIVDPTQALDVAEWAAIDAFLARGGRVMVTASHRYPDGAGSTRAWLRRYGIEMGLGYVAEPIAGPAGVVVGVSECANVFCTPENLSIQHPITEPMARFGRKLWAALARPMSRANPGSNIVLSELARSSERGWVDLPDAQGRFDWRPDSDRETTDRRLTLAMAAELSPVGADGPLPPELRGRIVALGSPEMLSSRLMATNKDFALNAFNWLAAREYRLSVRTQSEVRRILDVQREGVLFELRSLVLFALPGLCLCLGLVTWYRRRR